MFANVLTVLGRFGGRALLYGKKHLPEILTYTGVIGFVGSVVTAVKATTKIEELIAEKERLEALADQKLAENTPEYTEADRKNDARLFKIQTRWKVVKAALPTVTLVLLSATMILCGFGIISGRAAASAAAYKGLETAYRQVVRENTRLRMQTQEGALEGQAEGITEGEKKDSEGANLAVVEPKKGEARFNAASPYAVWFDEQSSRYWKPDLDANKFFLTAVLREMNDILNSRGYLFLNDVYEALGMRFGKDNMPYTKVGTVVGWVLSKDGSTDNCVDFGMDDPMNQSAWSFKQGKSNRILLDFNVDGIVYDLV